MEEDNEFPWHIGVYDAHCHPTDTMEQIRSITDMRARVLIVMATRTQDQKLVARSVEQYGTSVKKDQEPQQRIVPAFGHHPWFSYKFCMDEKPADMTTEKHKVNHYERVLDPKPDGHFIKTLPDPLPFNAQLEMMIEHLKQFPFALVGEVGLDKSFRIPEAWREGAQRDNDLTPGGREGRRLTPYRVKLDHQTRLLQSQLRLAAKFRRAVSVHGVQAHGILHDALMEVMKDTSPPRICLHSYSGSAGTLQQYKSAPCDVYFSFSTTINTWNDKVEAAVRAVPDNRILIESDLHVAGQAMDEYLEGAARKVCSIKGWSLTDGVEQLARNWKQFVGWSEMVDVVSKEDP